jgi:cell division protein FtsI (penicillin-binding protein 3)
VAIEFTRISLASGDHGERTSDFYGGGANPILFRWILKRMNMVFNTPYRKGLVMRIATILFVLFLFLAASCQQETENEDVPGINLVVDTQARKLILDRNNIPVAINEWRYTVCIDTKAMHENKKRKEDVLSLIATHLQLADRASEFLGASGLGIRFLIRRADPKLNESIEAFAQKVVEGGFQDIIQFRLEPVRNYPHGAVAGHLLGYTRVDDGGVEGVERSLDSELLLPATGTGKESFRILPQNLAGFRESYRTTHVSAGNAIKLAIDIELQKHVEASLEDACNQVNARSCYGMVLDSRTFELHSLAVLPRMDPNKPGQSSSEIRQNGAIAHAYEPGGIAMVLPVIAGFEAGLIKDDDLFDSGHSQLRIRKAVFHDRLPFEKRTVTSIVAHSSTTGIVQIMDLVGIDRYLELVKGLGLAGKTGIELPSETEGIFRNLTRPNFIERDFLAASFGQSIAFSPFQATFLYAVIANGGKAMRPTVRFVESPRELEERLVFSEETANRVMGVLEYAVTDGTGQEAQTSGLRVLGKTGLSQMYDSTTAKQSTALSSFVGILLQHDARFVIGVFVTHPQGDRVDGGELAAPVFRRIAEYLALRLTPETR